MENVNKTEEFKDWVKGLLNDANVKDLCVTFKKANGEERELFCTLVESRIPEDKRPKNKVTRTSDDSQAVFDIKLNDWRAFRWDSIQCVAFTMGDKNEV